MTELCLRIRCTLKLYDPNVMLEVESQKEIEAKTDRLIKWGRILMISTICCLDITTIVICSIIMYREPLTLQQRENITRKDANVYVPALQLLSFTLLTTSISVLLYLLCKQQRFFNRMSGLAGYQADQMRKEFRTLIIVLVVFDTSYLLRAVYDRWIIDYTKDDPNIFFPISITISVFFDLIPLLLVLSYHRRNFKQNNEKLKVRMEDADLESTERGLSGIHRSSHLHNETTQII